MDSNFLVILLSPSKAWRPLEKKGRDDQLDQSGAATNFGDHTYRQIWGPTVTNNIYILIHEYSSTGFE